MLLSSVSGDVVELHTLLAKVAPFEHSEDPQELGQVALARSAAAAFAGQPAEALEQAKRALRHGHSLGPGHHITRWGWPIAADAALALDDHEQVAMLLDWLNQHPPGHIPPVLQADQLRIRARLLAVTNDPRSSSEAAAAIEALRKLDSPYHLAVGLLDQAEFLTAAGHAGADSPLISEARSIAARLGARPLLDRVDRLLDGQLLGADQALRPSSRT